MYPEVAVLSGLFMICPSSVEREIRFLLPVLWNYFKEFVRWPTAEQWLEMANHWQMFPGTVAVIDGTRHRRKLSLNKISIADILDTTISRPKL